MRTSTTIAAVLSVVAAAGWPATAPAGRTSSPKVLEILVTGSSVEMNPPVVGLDAYTLQIHNIGQYALHIRIPRLLNVVVPANGWRFRAVTFVRPGHYPVRAVNLAGASSLAVLTAQR